MIFHNSDFDFRRQNFVQKLHLRWPGENSPPKHSKMPPRRSQDGPRSSQTSPKTPPRRPKMPPRRPQDAPRGPQDDPKTTPRRPQDGPKTLPRRPQDGRRRPKTPQDPSKTLPSHLKPPPDNDFGTILRSLWKMFGRSFARNCRPTCLLELTFQISNYLKKAEQIQRNTFRDAPDVLITRSRARCGRCRRHLDK